MKNQIVDDLLYLQLQSQLCQNYLSSLVDIQRPVRVLDFGRTVSKYTMLVISDPKTLELKNGEKKGRNF